MLTPCPHGVIANALCAPCIIAWHTSVVEHHAVADIYFSNVGSLGAKSSACARIDDEVGLEPLDGTERGHCCGFTPYKVTAVLLYVQHYVESGTIHFAFIQLAGQGGEESLHLLDAVSFDEWLGFSHHRYNVTDFHIMIYKCEFIQKQSRAGCRATAPSCLT